MKLRYKILLAVIAIESAICYGARLFYKKILGIDLIIDILPWNAILIFALLLPIWLILFFIVKDEKISLKRRKISKIGLIFLVTVYIAAMCAEVLVYIAVI
ncbi:MAG: hypothetical protein IJ021_01280 [Clostridia bacterium]|nr:hypothetical protein [Clostridia bacterium]